MIFDFAIYPVDPLDKGNYKIRTSNALTDEAVLDLARLSKWNENVFASCSSGMILDGESVRDCKALILVACAIKGYTQEKFDEMIFHFKDKDIRGEDLGLKL